MATDTEHDGPYVIDADNAAPIPADPWAHRSKGMRCRTCMWFVAKTRNVGRCRRHAPTMNGYPVVYVTDWCGDHKLNEHADGYKETL